MVQVATWRISGCCLLKSRWTSSQRTWLLRPELLMLGRVSREEEKRMLDMSVSLLAEYHSTIYSHSLGLDSNQLQEGPPCFAKQIISPPDSWDPPAVSSHGRKCLLVLRKKLFIPLTAGTRQIWWLTCGPTKRTSTHGFVNLINK